MLTRLVILVGLVFAASCDDSPTVPEPEDQSLTVPEVAGIVELVVATGLFPSPLPESNPSPCPLGGTTERTLLFSSPQAGSIVREGSVTFTECRGGAGGRTYAISGTITVDDRFVLESGTIITAEGAYAGTLAWNLDTRAGSCSLSLAVSLIDDGLVVSGTACGVEVEHAV